MEQPNESDRTDGDAATHEEEIPMEKSDESIPMTAPDGSSGKPQEESSSIDLSYLASIWHTLSPSEQLSTLSALSIDQYHTLQQLLVRRLNGKEGMPKDAELDGENVPAEQSAEPVEAVTESFGTEDGLVQIAELPGQLPPRLFD